MKMPELAVNPGAVLSMSKDLDEKVHICSRLEGRGQWVRQMTTDKLDWAGLEDD
jgi:hypothetical protein